MSSFWRPSSTVSLSLPNPFLPAYTTSTFTLPSFTHHRLAGNVLFSPPVLLDGVAWRLKVYAGGNGVGKSGYVSVFVEMVGHADLAVEPSDKSGQARPEPEPGAAPAEQNSEAQNPGEVVSRYQYKIELVSVAPMNRPPPNRPVSERPLILSRAHLTQLPSPTPSNHTANVPPPPPPPLSSSSSPSGASAEGSRTGRGRAPAGTGPCLSREYTSAFTPGECWGYNKFCRVATLVADGYWREGVDCLTFRWGVRAATWKGKTADLERCVVFAIARVRASIFHANSPQSPPSHPGPLSKVCPAARVPSVGRRGPPSGG